MISHSLPADLTRRHLIYGSAGMAAAGLFPSAPLALDETGDGSDAEKRPVVLIGRFASEKRLNDCLAAIDQQPEFKLNALADADEAWHETARAQTGVSRTYPDFRILLGAEEPELVIIGSGLGADRQAAIVASLEAGAHVFIDGPLTGSLAEIDHITSLAHERERSVAVANPLGFDPLVREFVAHAGDLIGDIVEIRILGNRDGGNSLEEDLIETGVGLFDIVRRVAGEPKACCALPGKTGDGGIRTHFQLDGGAYLTFISRPGLNDTSGGPGIELTGTRTSARLYLDPKPAVAILQNPAPGNPNRGDLWRKWTADESTGNDEESPPETPVEAASEFGDWLEAIKSDREADGSIAGALRSLEMAHAVIQSADRGETIAFPIADRERPLALT